MKMLRELSILGALAGATPAFAAPVYLKCLIDQEGGPLEVNFVLDEETESVASIIPKTGAVDRVKGTFLADRVMVSNGVAAYELNRVDLTVTRKLRYLKQIDKGACKVTELPKRAF